MTGFEAALVLLVVALTLVGAGYGIARLVRVAPAVAAAGPFLSGSEPTEHAFSRFHVRWYPLSAPTARWCCSLSGVGLAVKTPTVPFHTWLGLPGFSGFIAEFQIFTGSLASATVATALAVLGILITAGLFLRALQRILLGPLRVPDALGAASRPSRQP